VITEAGLTITIVGFSIL